MSRTRLALAMAAVGFAALITAGPASAARVAPLPIALMSHQILVETPAVELVRWRGGYCRNWGFTCADRWGWGTPRFRRCMWRHDC